MDSGTGLMAPPPAAFAGPSGRVPVVSSATPYACGLACLESLARERGVAFDHTAFIAREGKRFRGWDRMPGLTRLDIAKVGTVWTLRWDLYDLARELGLASKLTEFTTRRPLEAFLLRPGTAAFALLQRYPEQGDPCTHAHAVRILGSQDGALLIMDPGRKLPAQMRVLDWEQFRAWEPRVFGMD
jgi:hypothetical protein